MIFRIILGFLGFLVLTITVAPFFFQHTNCGSHVHVRSELRNIWNAVEMYRQSKRELPPSLEVLYLEGFTENEIGNDPWGNPYAYFMPGSDSRLFDIISYGADGILGGEGNDADISCWDIIKE